ncbi:MAG: bifunctional hydroxymethylpyrimidine kinase/phosphomethylpyrimidine kinase [Acidimicrobiales bacterium]
MIPGWPAALSVAGSDSWGGAGIEADLRTFAEFGVWGAVAVTAVTAQNHKGVLASTVMPADLVVEQIAAVADALSVGALKTGMLGDAAVIEAVAAAYGELHLGPLVVDPVQAASHGGSLLEADALPRLVSNLLPVAALVTPNIPEAEAILGVEISGRDDMALAAREIALLGPAAVLIKGGHLAGDVSPDLLWAEGKAIWLEGPKLKVRHSHGTGCTLSAAITAGLARGGDLVEACRAAKAYVSKCLGALTSG